MKHLILKSISVLMLVAIIIGFPSCEEDQDQWIYKGEALASFPDETSGTFFVQDVTDPSFEIKVALNTTSSSERKVYLSVDTALSTAVLGTHFTMDTIVTIPANEVIGNLVVKGIYANLPNEALSIVINIAGENAAAYDNVFNLGLNKFVPFEIANFTGTFECVEHSFFGDFTYDVTLTEVDGENAVTITPFGAGMEAAYGLPLGGMNDLKVVFRISDPAAYSTYMAEAEAFVNGDVPSNYSETTGNLNTLTNSFSLGQVVIADAEGPWDIISSVEFTKK